MGSFHQRKWSDNKQYAVEVRWGIFYWVWRIFSFIRAVVNIPIQTLLISPWPLLRKIIISQLELGPPVHDVDLVSLRGEKNLMDINPTKKNHILQLNEVQNCSVEPRWRYLCKIRVGISNRLSHRDQAGMSVLGTRLINLRWRN